MSPPEPTLLTAAQQVADGVAVDWDRLEASSAGVEVPALRELKVLERIAALHQRAASVATDAPTLEDATPGASRAPIRVPGRWSRLEIREAIGSGGFGNVYRAWDPTLEREVALKLLVVPKGDPNGAATVLAEGRRLARVRHPNVMSVYGAERVDDRVGIWGELIRGRTLAALVSEDGPMGAQEAALVGITLCHALAAVHRAGLLHRDVKAQNVIREQGGRIVLVDLGAGRPLRAESPDDHDLRGTPLYMAPELFSGAPASPISDRYSLGVLLYYLVTGRFPYRGDTPSEVSEAFARGDRQSLRDLRPDLPEGFVRVVERAISPDPAERPKSDGELESELARSIGLDTPVEHPAGATTPRRPRWRRPTVARVTLAAVLLTLVLLVLSRGEPPPPPPLPPSIALTSIQSVSQDPADDYLASGLTSVIESNLGSIPGLLILPAVAPGTDAEALGVSYVLSGTIQRSGQHLRATLQLSRSAAGSLAWSRSFDGLASEPFDLQARVIDELVRGLKTLDLVDEAQITAMRERLDANPTSDPDAFAAYSRGIAQLDRADRPGQLEQAVASLEDAVERDPSFALAHAALAAAYWETYERTLDPSWTRHAAEHSQRALELAPDVPRVRQSLAAIYHGSGQSREAIAELQKAIALQPMNDAAYRLLGRIHADLGENGRAEAALRKAIELRPAFSGGYASLGVFLWGIERYEEAIAVFRLEVGLQPENAAAHQRLATAYHAVGDLAKAEQAYRRSIELGPTATALSGLGTIFYGDGRVARAVEAYERAIELSPNVPANRRNLGDAYRRLGNREAAAEAYRAAAELATQALQVDPSDASTRALLALCLAKLDRFSEARSAAERAEKDRPDDAEVLYMKAAVLALAGEEEQALTSLSKAIDAGYTKSLLRDDEDFALLRGSPRFEALLSP